MRRAGWYAGSVTAAVAASLVPGFVAVVGGPSGGPSRTQQCSFSLTPLRRNLESPGLEAATRLVRPTPNMPATGPSGMELDPSDPCVLWREYWSVADEMPYYHNLETNEVTWDVPDGFLTRFPTFHGNNESLMIDKDGRVRSAMDGATPQPGQPLTLKKKLALYGSGGLVLYLIIHNVCLLCVFVSIYFLQIDLVGLARSYGFNIKRSDDPQVAAAEKRSPSFFGTFFTAVLLNKLTVPLQLTATLLLAPRFVPKLQPFANRIGPKIKQYLAFLPIGHKKKASIKRV